ncbi:MAG: ImmA/IrrE family metallo-endopeptidase [Planctomycetales bacterium]|nr:ImmA/IrrE family metallo-endopeptidase [Planctomycetales bacterium]
MNVDAAIVFAREHYPEGPEKLVEQLQVAVYYSELGGCDGWCLTTGDHTLIRINCARAKSSQRFTLAHELGHLLLGIPSIVGETLSDMLGSNSEEERRVNQVAAELLMPLDVVKTFVPHPPVVAKSLEKLAKAANVSPLSAAVRVTTAAGELGLQNAAVLQYDGDDLRWMWSPSLRITTTDTPLKLLQATRQVHPLPHREVQEDGVMVVASLIENPKFESSTVFVQLLSEEHGLQQSPAEQRQSLESQLFPKGNRLRAKVDGCFGAFKHRCSGMTLQQAEAAFWDRYQTRLHGSAIDSALGRQYVTLRLSEWCPVSV